jgi:protein arginine kinase
MGFAPVSDELFTRGVQWLAHDQSTGIVLSTRVRLARNLSGYAFPARLGVAGREAVLSAVRAGVAGLPLFADGYHVELTDVDNVVREGLLERHLISRELNAGGPGCGVFISRDETCGVMVNGEDLLRLQGRLPGRQLTAAWQCADEVDNDLNGSLTYAFSPELGYLTSCPTNLGTGMRASVMLHLPGLVLNECIDGVLNAVRRLGWAARGFCGEGTEHVGNIFQLSNQSTLGEDERTIISRLAALVEQIASHEMNARQLLIERRRTRVCDHVARAYGVLRHAFTLDTEETLDYLSALRLGLDLGMFSGLDRETLDELWILTQKGHLQKHSGCELGGDARGASRASLVRQRLAGGADSTEAGTAFSAEDDS